MENKAAEIPEKGFVESELCTAVNPGDKLLESPEPVLFCKLSENVVASCESSSIKSAIGIESVMSDAVIASNETCEGFLDADRGDKSISLNDASKVGNDDGSALGGDLKSGENKETSIPHEPGPTTTIDVSGDGIDLFVEVFGPSDDMYDSNDVGNRVLAGKGLDQDCGAELNGTLSVDVNNENEDADKVGKEERSFVVSDLVWVKNHTQVWWPGMISDISTSAKDDATIPGKKGSFLVKYFGNSSSIWCSNSDMKPYVEYFEEFSQKNTLKSFTGSVQKALGELSRRIKSNMSCPCFTKESQPLSQRLNEKKISSYDVRSVPQFDPTSFYARIRELASAGSVPGKIDWIIMENTLWGFYRSVGHHQLPLQLLKSTSDGDDNSKENATVAPGRRKRNSAVTTSPVPDDNVISSGKGSEPRPRKKSKYLSYPYVDASKGVDASKSGEVDKSTSQATATGTNSRKTASKKHFKANDKVSKADNITASELLEGLLATALDCSYLSRSKYSDFLSNFYCSFRMYAFQDAKVSSKLAGVEIEDIITVKETENQGVNHEPVKENSNSDASNKLLEQNNLPVKGNAVRKRRAKKKKEEETPINLEFKTDSSPLVPCVINFQRTWSDAPKSKDENEAASTQLQESTKPNSGEVQLSFRSGGPSADQGEVLPENSNGAVVSPYGVCQATTSTSCPSLRDVPVTFQSIPQVNSIVGLNGISGNFMFTEPTPSTVNSRIILPAQNPVGRVSNPSSGIGQVQGGEFVFNEPDLTMISMGFGSPIQNPPGLMPSSGQPESKKRKRKEKTSQVASAIPDLNGNVLEKASIERHVELQPNELGLNAKRRVSNTKEDPGGGLLLKFSPEYPPPSKETLVTIFSRFGLLKESEIQFLDDSSCTQIMYERSSDAGFAFRSLEKSNPFGESLVSFNLHGMPGADLKPPVKKRKVKVVQEQQPIMETSKSPAKNPAVETIKSPAKQGEARDIAVIKKNVEMMKSALEKAGDSLSPEMRAKLENEIKSFLDKIGGGSS